MRLTQVMVPSILIDGIEYRILDKWGKYLLTREIYETNPRDFNKSYHVSDEGKFTLIYTEKTPVIVAQSSSRDLSELTQALSKLGH